MTQTEITHSSFIYDRKPIVVLPNACALPERGERAMDSAADADYDLELWVAGRRKKKVTKGYFHPRAYEAVEYEAVDSDQAELSSSLLFARDSSSFLSSPYRIQNDTTLFDSHARALSHFRPIQTVGTLDGSEAAYDPLNGPIDACQFIQHLPHMDLSLPFMPQKQKTGLRSKECASSPKKRTTTRSRTTGSTNNFERTFQLVSNAGCGGFNEPGLEGCLGGF